MGLGQKNNILEGNHCVVYTICPPQKFEATYSGWDDETALHKFMEDIMSTADDMEVVKSKLSLMETSKIL